MTQIPIYQPYMRGNEKQYVTQCLDTNWISSKGEFIDKFENLFANYIGASYATSVCNGTVALHLVLAALGLTQGDEVIVPTLTYIAPVNMIAQTGATPVFVDSLIDSWQMNPEEIMRKITSKTKAIIAVHLYGHPCDMDPIVKICQENNLYLIEDCAEAFGSKYKNQSVGTFGNFATFSFYGNKTITTGEGGMVVTNDRKLYEQANHLKSQGTIRQYWHDVIAYNYRMTNIQAAIGLAQLEQADDIIRRKRQIAKWYQDNLRDLPLETDKEIGEVVNSFWMASILLNTADDRINLQQYLQEKGVESRPFFSPIHLMPSYVGKMGDYPIAESIGARGMNLPSWPQLSREQVEHICGHIKDYLSHA